MQHTYGLVDAGGKPAVDARAPVVAHQVCTIAAIHLVLRSAEKCILILTP